ncbi:hypothetical protein DXA57_16170 [Blautia sp. OF03-15BH]|uniref:hypothetical protein n=1 Tax=Blautia sp. OF03-15BH TaxID=2292287 RepID=UPI000E4D5549|nr:hypothetical protein [Blautia sp. OF03-15BH]RGX96928.1 hypothetical protein DXA57_16170 [Blautia sp. OF03-15BH]
MFWDKWFNKNVKVRSNSITAGKVGGDIYQGNTIINVDPATSVLNAASSADNMSVTMDSIAQAIKRTELLPKGYGEKIIMENGRASISSVITDVKAASANLQKIKGSFRIKACKNQEELEELLQRAYISQTPIEIDMVEMKKMIGDMEDPFQEEFQKEIEGCKFQITPPELPEAKQCVFGVKDSAFYYDDIWLRMKPVDPDDHILVLSNDEHCSDLRLTLTYYGDTGKTTIDHAYINKGWMSIKKYLEFMKAADAGTELYIRIKNTETDFFKATLQAPFLGEEYDRLESEIRFIRNIMLVEAYFNVSFDSQKIFEPEEIELINFLAKSIRNIPETFTWENFSCSGVGKLPDGEKPFVNPEEFSISFESVVDITIQNHVLESIRVKTKFDTAKYEEGSVPTDFSDGTRIDIKLVPASSNKGNRIAILD